MTNYNEAERVLLGCTKTMTLMRYRKFYKENKELLNEYLIWRITNEL